MTDVENELTEMLREKRICRFCLTQEEPMSNIYSNENRKNSRAPLPLQIMACVSIEVKIYPGTPVWLRSQFIWAQFLWLFCHLINCSMCSGLMVCVVFFGLMA